MLKRFYQFVDLFLPKNLIETVDVVIFYRARSIVISSVLGIFVLSILFLGSTYFKVSTIVNLRIFFGIVSLVCLLGVLKTRKLNFEKVLTWGGTFQIMIILSLVYSSVLFEIGLGFFSLVWLMPIGLLTAFYFDSKVGALCILINMLLMVSVIFFKHESFFLPIEALPHFKGTYLLSAFLVVFYSSILSYFILQLNELLKDELAQQKNKLVESAKFQSLGQMASNLAHDINNPLFSIQGKLHQMRNLLSQDQLNLAKCDSIVEEVESTLLKLSQIVKGISTFARQSEGDQMVSLNAQDLIQGIVLLGADRIIQSGIGFDVVVHPNTYVICYPSYISQILINLINNAVDAVENSVVKKIKIEVFSKKDWVEFQVIDTGPGVNPEIESKIFESFFTTKKYGKGTGLGLSISRGLVKAHEGELLYERREELTYFIIKLPSYD